MAYSRAYPTGKTRTFTFTAALSLMHCGAAPIHTPEEEWHHECTIPYDEGWLGEGVFHPYYDQCEEPSLPDISYGNVGGSQGHGVGASCAWGSLGIGTGFIRDGFVPKWRTSVDLSCGGETLRVFESDDTVIGTKSATLVATVTCEEWAYELDGGIDAPDKRPEWAGTPALVLAWKPIGNVHVSGGGGAITKPVEDVFGLDSIVGERILWEYGLFRCSASASNNEWYYPGTAPELTTLPASFGLGDLPSHDTVFATASINMSPISTFYRWSEHQLSAGDFPSSPSRSFHAYEHGGSCQLTITGDPIYAITINGAIRDWNGPLTGIPVTFKYTNWKPSQTVNFSGSRVIDTMPVVNAFPVTDGFHVPAALGNNGTADGPIFRYGPTWNAVRLERADSLPVEDFSVIGGTNGWVGFHTTADPVYTAPYLSVTGDSSGSQSEIRKSLKSDFYDLRNDPYAWITAHGASLSAEVQAFIANTGLPGGTPHVGEWWKIGRKLLPGSDVFNWSSYRYAELIGFADTACAVTVEVSWVLWNGESETGGFPETDQWNIDLTDAEAVHRIDLGKAVRGTMRHVRQWRILFPNGRTVTFRSLRLVSDSKPLLDCHQPYQGDVVSALADGKWALMFDENNPPGWGWPATRPVYPGDGTHYDGSQTVAEWVREINLQEGWTATALAEPLHGTPNYVVWLQEAFKAATPATLPARRSFGVIYCYPAYNGSFDMEANLGTAVEVLVFDAVTEEPIRADLSLYRADTTALLDTAISDGRGYAQMETTWEDSLIAYASKGKPEETSDGAFAKRRTWMAVVLRGVPLAETGAGDAILDCDRPGNQHVAFVRDGIVTYARKMGEVEADTADWEYFDVAAGSDPYLHFSERDARGLIYLAFMWGTDRLSVAASSTNGATWRSLRDMGTGRKPVLRLDKDPGLLYATLWNADSLWLLRSPDGGASWLESPVEIVSSVPEGRGVIDFRRDSTHTLDCVFAASDGSVKQRSSADNGLSWGEEITIAAAGTDPFLRYDKPGVLAHYTFWNDGTHWLLRSDDSGVTFRESPVSILAAASSKILTVDFLRGTTKRLKAVYADGSTLAERVSMDGGLTWD